MVLPFDGLSGGPFFATTVSVRQDLPSGVVGQQPRWKHEPFQLELFLRYLGICLNLTTGNPNQDHTGTFHQDIWPLPLEVSISDEDLGK